MGLFSASSLVFLTRSPAIHVHSILFKGHHKICIAYPIYIFSFKSMKEGHDLKKEKRGNFWDIFLVIHRGYVPRL